MKDFYETLGLTKTATDEEIKKAYKKAAKENHPDKNPGDEAAIERFKAAKEAYETLSDPVKKSFYDRGETPGPRVRRPSASPFSPFEEVMEGFFGGNSFKGRNISVRIEIDLKEVLSGCNKQIKIKKRKRCTGCHGEGATGFEQCKNCHGRGFAQVSDAPFNFQQACPICAGQGRTSTTKCVDCAGTGLLSSYTEKELTINIPKGIENGMQLRIPGEGEQSKRTGGSDGDVIVFILVKEHPFFIREGANLTVEVPVSYTQLVLGGEIDIPTLLEGLLSVKIPPGSQSHTKFRVKGKGLINVHGVIGDLIATVKIETPKILDEDYQKIIESLAEVEKKNVTPRRESWAKNILDNK